MQILIIHIFRPILLLLLLVGGVSGELMAQPPAEEQVKAAFLFNFTQFIEWPDSAFQYEGAPLIIGVYGNNPFGSFLENLIDKEYSGTHPIVVRYVKSPDEISQCHILYIEPGFRVKVKEVLEITEHKAVLTVSDAENFIEIGGMVRFKNVDNRIRFQINPDKPGAAGIKISSKVLRLAEIASNSQ